MNITLLHHLHDNAVKAKCKKITSPTNSHVPLVCQQVDKRSPSFYHRYLFGFVNGGHLKIQVKNYCEYSDRMNLND